MARSSRMRLMRPINGGPNAPIPGSFAPGSGGGGGLVPANNQTVWAGDSRLATMAAEAPDPKRLNISGSVSNALQTAGYKARVAVNGNRAIGGDTTAAIVARLGDIVANPAGIVVLLAGVNDAADTAATITNMTTILNALRDAGKIVVLCNELPRDTDPASQVVRRNWLEDPARKVTWPNIVQVDTFRPCLKDGTTGTWKDGFTLEPAGSGLHPNALGNVPIGQAIGAALGTLCASFPSTSNLPLPSESVRSPSNPTGPVLNNYALAGSVAATGTNVSGAIPTGYGVLNAGGGDVAVACSVVVNADGHRELVARITGSMSGTGTTSIVISNEGAGGSASILDRVAAGDEIWSVARIKTDASPVGYRGTALTCRLSASSPSYADLFVNGNGIANVALPGPLAYDASMSSHIGVVRSDWASQTLRTLQTQVVVSIAPSSPIDITVRLSQVAVRARTP